MKVWIVDAGAYTNNYIDKIFLSQDAAEAYAKSENDKAAAEAIAKGGPRFRPIGSWWDVTDHEVEEK
jgi:hypothetical protein